MKRRLALAAFVAVVASARPTRAGEGSVAGARPPAENSCYVPDDRDETRRDAATADEALATHDLITAVRALQRMAGGPHDAVVSTGEAGVFEGVEFAAHLRVVAAGAACLDAYEREFGVVAEGELNHALAARDERGLARVVQTYRPCAAARRAALLLADLAIERADSDEAFEQLDGLEDLEDAAAPDLDAAVAGWRLARRLRAVAALAKDRPTFARAAAAIRAGGEGDLARPDRLRAAPSPDWPTTGGDATRSRVAPALGPRLRHTSSEYLGLRPPSALEEYGLAQPSPWIAPRAVVANGLIYVSDGRALRVFDVGTGAYRLAVMPFAPHADPEAGTPAAGRASRRRFGWIEGHGLTVDGARIFVALTEERDASRSREPDEEPVDAAAPAQSADRTAAFDLVDGTLVARWTRGGRIDTPGLASGMRLYGTPLLYRGAIHVTGLRPSGKTRDRLEAWHVALDPSTGDVRSATFLGVGGPIRRGRDDEAMPASCAAAHGRVVVVTSLGIAAAVDAISGRTRWSCRYDRGRPDGDDLGHRLDDSREESDRRTSFANEPPIVVDGRVLMAPTDSRHVFALADRPRGRARALRLWRRHRVDDFRNLAVEQLVGAVGLADTDAPVLVLVGKGHELEGSPHTAVVGLDPATGSMRWERALPVTRDPEPYGRALVTAGEVYVSTRDGIARYRVEDGADLPFLDAAAIEKDGGDASDAYGETFQPVGNLVPIPGHGLVALNPESISIWRVP